MENSLPRENDSNFARNSATRRKNIGETRKNIAREPIYPTFLICGVLLYETRRGAKDETPQVVKQRAGVKSIYSYLFITFIIQLMCR
jgi:hypothetical protein